MEEAIKFEVLRMENKNENPGDRIDFDYDQQRDQKAEDQQNGFKPVSEAQIDLLKKLLKSKKLLDKEYRNFQELVDSRIVNSKDMSVLIAHILATIQFRRHFSGKRQKAYKRCIYCESRDNVERFLHVETGKKFWICDNCDLNLDSRKFVRTKYAEENELKADLIRKEQILELTPEQENLINEHREI